MNSYNSKENHRLSGFLFWECGWIRWPLTFLPNPRLRFFCETTADRNSIFFHQISVGMHFLFSTFKYLINIITLAIHVFEFTCRLCPRTFIFILLFFSICKIHPHVICGHIRPFSVPKLVPCEDRVIRKTF